MCAAIASFMTTRCHWSPAEVASGKSVSSSAKRRRSPRERSSDVIAIDQGGWFDGQVTSSDEPQRFFFVHIMKTGGTALTRQLRTHFGDALYPTRGVDGTDMWALYLVTDRLRERLAARGDQIQVIAGHFPLCTVELIDGPVTTLTILREPVERVLSLLRSAGRGSLEEAHDRLLNQTVVTMKGHPALDPHNSMTRMLSLTRDEMRASRSGRVDLRPEHLERAKEGLAGVDVVGLQERFGDFCGELAARFGWRLGEPEMVNTTDPVEVPDGLRDQIAEENALDVELSEFARQLLSGVGPIKQRVAND